MFTLPSSPPPSHSKVSQHDKISIPKPSPRTVKLWFSPFSHKSQIDTGNFFCLQCNRKICFYLEAIQKSSLFLECEITEEYFSKRFLSINYVRATKGFYLLPSPWGFEGSLGVKIPGNWEAYIFWKNKPNFQLKKYGQEMSLHLKWCPGTSLVAQWLRIRLPMQGTLVRSLLGEDPTCHGATKPVHHNYWPHAPELLKPARLEPVVRNKRSHHNEKPVHHNEEWPPLAATRESPRTATKTQHGQINK